MSIPALTTLDPDGANRLQGMSAMNQLVDDSGRFDRLQSAFQKQLKSLANEFYKTYHQPLVLTDTLRTDAEQAQAHRAKPYLALPAGHPNAMHPRGLAVDTDIHQSKMLTPEMLAHNGLHRPALSKGETWHLEPVSTKRGGASSSDWAENEPSFSPVPAQFQPGSKRVLSSRLTQRASEFKAQCQRPDASSPLKRRSLNGQGAPADQAKLRKTAIEVESVFLEQLLGQMRSSMVDPINPTRKQFRGYLSMADQHLARSLAAGGGIGMASRIIKDLAKLDAHPHTEKPHEGNTPAPDKTGTPPGTKPV